MEMFNILTIIGGLMFSVIGYFLKSTMSELKSVKDMSYDTRNKLDILSNDHNNKYDNLTEKMTELKEVISDLTKELKHLNRRA